MDGLVYFAAGRSSFLDGGITVCAARPESGEVVHRIRVEQPGTNATESGGHPYWADGSEAYLLVAAREAQTHCMAPEALRRPPVADHPGRCPERASSEARETLRSPK